MNDREIVNLYWQRSEQANLILEMDYSSHQILQPDQVDALIFASNFPWARTLTDSELTVIPVA